jgi:hypothetical protein
MENVWNILRLGCFCGRFVGEADLFVEVEDYSKHQLEMEDGYIV